MIASVSVLSWDASTPDALPSAPGDSRELIIAGHLTQMVTR
jgi:hypothetical protein